MRRAKNAERGEQQARGGREKGIIFLLTFVTSYAYIIYRVLYTLPFNRGFWSLFFGIVVMLAEFTAILGTLKHFANTWKVEMVEMPVIAEEMYPNIDILIATHNESAALLYKTINACKYMKYPDLDKVHIFVCDDQNRQEICELAKAMDVGYFSLVDNKEAKAGNLNNALLQTSSDLVAFFDADMIPTSDFLLELVPYFFDTKMVKDGDAWRERTEEDAVDARAKLAYVQSQHSFYNVDMFQQNLGLVNHMPNEQDYFHRKINVARNHTNSALFAGSNAIFLREALEEVGGLATYSVTEDTATSIEVLSKGYRSLAVDKELTHGLAPEDADSLIKQRQRWARGTVQAIATKRFLNNDLPWKAKWNFYVSYVYWWGFLRKLIFIISPIVCGIFGLVIADVNILNILMFWIPYYFFYSWGSSYVSDRTTSSFWGGLVDTIFFPYLIMPVITGGVSKKHRTFWVTPKERIEGRNSTIMYAIPHIILIVLSLIAIVGVVQNLSNLDYGSIFVLFWLSVNLYYLIIAVFYYKGTIRNQEDENIKTSLPISIYHQKYKVEGTTELISEHKIVALLEGPYFVPYDINCSMDLVYNDYSATIKVRLLNVEKYGDCWKYDFSIMGMSEEARSMYYQMIYDRKHSFVKEFKVNVVTILKHIFKKTEKAEEMDEVNRLPKIEEELVLKTKEKIEIVMQHFNYRYLLVENKEELPENLTIKFSARILVNCIKRKIKDDLLEETNLVLYEIVDWKEVAMNTKFGKCLLQLLNEKNGVQSANNEE